MKASGFFTTAPYVGSNSSPSSRSNMSDGRTTRKPTGWRISPWTAAATPLSGRNDGSGDSTGHLMENLVQRYWRTWTIQWVTLMAGLDTFLHHRQLLTLAWTKPLRGATTSPL